MLRVFDCLQIVCKIGIDGSWIQTDYTSVVLHAADIIFLRVSCCEINLFLVLNYEYINANVINISAGLSLSLSRCIVNTFIP